MKLIYRFIFSTVCFSLSFTSYAFADEQANNATVPRTMDVPEKNQVPIFSIKPVLLDSSNSTAATLGLDYSLNKTFKLGGSAATGVGSPTINPGDENIAITKGAVVLFARGTLASDSAKTTNKLLDFSAKGFYVIDTLPAFYKIGGVLTYETDQSRQNKQSMFGIAGAMTKMNVLVQGDGVTVLLNFGRVNPAADTERRKILGTLNTYDRWNAELSYIIPTRNEQVRSIEFNYRHYQEISAPSIIRAAGLDVNKLALIRANLMQDFFFEYSTGTLPFDQKTVRTVKVGWSAKLM